MSRKINNRPETLEAALKEVIRHVRSINELEQAIDEAWGVKLVTGSIPGYIGDNTRGEINVRRGIEEIEKVLGKEAKQDSCIVRMKELRHNGIRFVQYADSKTKVFVKAGKEPPMVVIVDE